jgi:predicted dehydrogenase/putative sterol carrier protein
MEHFMRGINVGIIGCGRIADLHYKGYIENRDARIYAVCDTNSEAAQARKSEWKAIKAFTDYRELLLDSNIDAVEILTPHNLHEEMIVEAARAGKHIAVQKPMTINLKSADRILGETEKRSTIFKVTENYLFYPPIILARKMIEDGEIGEPINIRIKFVSGSSGGWKVPPSSWEWRMKEVLEGRGTSTFDHGHHLWSTAWFLLGDIERVCGWIDLSHGVVDCPSIVMWKYRDGKKYGVCDFAHAEDLHIPSNYYANDEWIEITGSKGIIFIRRCTGNIQEGPAMSIFDGKRMRNFSDIESDWGAGFSGATQNFVNAILGRESPLLSGRQGREILRFALAVQKTARVNREVHLDEMDSPFPAIYALKKWLGRRNRTPESSRRSLLSLVGLGEDLSKYAPQAKSLTEQFISKFDPSATAGWDLTIGIHLTEDGGVKEERYGLSIKNGKVELQQGRLPDNPKFTVKVPAGIWAAILLRKKRAEVAFLQGKLKVDGQAEEGLKLRAIFKL